MIRGDKTFQKCKFSNSKRLSSSYFMYWIKIRVFYKTWKKLKTELTVHRALRSKITRWLNKFNSQFFLVSHTANFWIFFLEINHSMKGPTWSDLARSSGFGLDTEEIKVYWVISSCPTFEGTFLLFYDKFHPYFYLLL